MFESVCGHARQGFVSSLTAAVEHTHPLRAKEQLDLPLKQKSQAT